MTFWLHIHYLYSISFIHIERFVSDARCMVRVSHERSNICPSVIVPLFLGVILILNDECVYRELLARIQVHTDDIRVYASRAKLFRGSTSFCGLHGIRPRDPGFIRMARKRFTRQARFKPPWKRHPASRRSSPCTGQSASEFTVFIRFSLSCVAMQALPFQGSLSMRAPVDCSRSRNSASLSRLGTASLPLESATVPAG